MAQSQPFLKVCVHNNWAFTQIGIDMIQVKPNLDLDFGPSPNYYFYLFPVSHGKKPYQTRPKQYFMLNLPHNKWSYKINETYHYSQKGERK